MTRPNAIGYLNVISHDGKVVFFCVDLAGTIWYAVKRGGFEDSALVPGNEPFGLEEWKELRLGVAVADGSVDADELASLTYASGSKYLLRSLYGADNELVRTVQAPVQLVSGLGHLYVFRQSPAGKLLVNRFVLDGMANELVPKIEVRFRRSRQRLKAETANGAAIDSLDFRDIDGALFHEPATWLAFAPETASGWFTVVLVPTSEGDRQRWHVFTYDKAEDRLVLHTLDASGGGLFAVKDRSVVVPGDVTIHRTEAGLVCRTLELTNLKVSGRPSAVLHDVQSEQNTRSGPQLVREAARLMLTIPVRETGAPDGPMTVVAINFAVGADGSLSQIDPSPDVRELLRSDTSEVQLPVDDFDNIKVIGASVPTPAGLISGMRRAGEDLLRVESRSTPPAVGDTVRLAGTRSYDGNYRVVGKDGSTFTVEANFTASEPGSWAVVPARETGLVFDNMVVGYDKTPDNKLKVSCTTHDLAVDDEVQIVGTDSFDGAVKVIAADATGFTLDAPWRPGEARNVKKFTRRGLVFDGVDDYLETPALEQSLPAGPAQSFGRTISAWIRVPTLKSRVQRLIDSDDDALELSLTADNKVQLAARFSDGTLRTVVDPNPVVANTWIHFAGTLAYEPAGGGISRMFLCRGGVKVLPTVTTSERLDGNDKLVLRETPGHLDAALLASFGGFGEVKIPEFNTVIASGSFSIEFWVRRDRSGVYEYVMNQRHVNADFGPDYTGLTIGFTNTSTLVFRIASDEYRYDEVQSQGTFRDTAWCHIACTYDAATKMQRVYCNGVLAAYRAAAGDYKGRGALFLGRGSDGRSPFKGQLAEVRVWQHVRGEAEIAANMYRRLSGSEAGLVGYWPLGGGSTNDRSSARRHGIAGGDLAWSVPTFRVPAVPIHGGLEFAASGQVVTCAGTDLSGQSFSISVWARRSPGNETQVLLSQGENATHKGLSLGFRSSGEFQFTFFDNDLVSTSSSPDAYWHHYCCTFDSATRQRVIYRDGAVIASGTAPEQYQGRGGWTIGSQGGTYKPFRGGLAELRIWGGVLGADAVKVDMWSCPTGVEVGLLGYWPLDRGQAQDLSPRRAHGTLVNGPGAVVLRHSIAGVRTDLSLCFAGEIADVRVWDRPVDARTIKDGMNLLLTGSEDGLLAYYRMGGVIAEDPAAPVVPDFTPRAAHARVIGAPDSGPRELARTTAGGAQVVKYSNAGLLAVRQRATYEERFEFKVTDDVTCDPNNVDGSGGKLFAFAYWGRRSAGSDDVLAVPADCVRQPPFTPAGGGWFVATCQVTIPEGVNLIRVFEIAEVKGTWKATKDWTNFQVRRHSLRMIADSVTRERYTDVVAAARLVGGGSAAFAEVVVAERALLAAYALVRDLLTRLDVAQNRQKYVNEKDALVPKVAAETTLVAQARSKLTNQEGHPGNYTLALRNVETGTSMSRVGDDWVTLGVNPGNTWEGGYVDELSFTLTAAGTGRLLRAYGDKIQVHAMFDTGGVAHWGYERDGRYYRIKSLGAPGCLLARQNVGSTVYVATLAASSGEGQLWEAVGKVVTTSGAERIEAARAEVTRLEVSLTPKKARLEELTRLLESSESAATVDGLLVTARAALVTARSTVDEKNGKVVFAAGTALRMPRVMCDDQGRITTAARLEFVRPIGAVHSLATCDGNVQLAHIDDRGRLRTAIYDATADSRNTTFEQWIVDGEWRCIDCRDSTDALTLKAPIALADEWTFEAWFQYPPVPASDGTPYMYNIFAGSAAAQLTAPLCIRGGNRLGMLVDGFFHDSGVDLDQTLAHGWHHAAVVCRAGVARFHLDGVAVGSAGKRDALGFDSAKQCWVELPALANSFVQGITVEAWVYLATPSEASTERGIITNVHHPTTSNVQFALTVQGADHRLRAGFYFQDSKAWRVLEDTPLPLNRWVHVAATYDGRYIRLYRDGVLVKTSADLNTALPTTGDVWRIGRRHDVDTPGSLWNGQIMEVRVWGAPRSGLELRDRMCGALVGDELGLVGYWPMRLVTDNSLKKVKGLGPAGKDGALRGEPRATELVPRGSAPISTLGNIQDGGSPAGKLAEVRVWRVGLGSAEIEAASKLVATGNEPDLIACWPLREGSGTTSRDRTGGNDAARGNARWVACTANLGNPGRGVARFVEDGAEVRCGAGINLANKSFSVEFWARRDRSGAYDFAFGQGTATTHCGLHLAFRDNDKFTFGFYFNDLDTGASYPDGAWHHWSCTYDGPTKLRTIYRDGEKVASDTAAAHFQGSGELVIGSTFDRNSRQFGFRGQLAEVRVWDRARTQDQVRGDMYRRLSGSEEGLLGYWPLAEQSAGVTPDVSKGARPGSLTRARIVQTTDLPLAGDVSVVGCEYATVGVDAGAVQRGMMRRCLALSHGAGARIFHDARVEALTLRWLGNVQYKPTLLGYIEGAPPVPSENLVFAGHGYNRATAVALTQTESVQYSWERSEAVGSGFKMDLFMGYKWEAFAGVGAAVKTSEGQVGVQGFYEFSQAVSRSSAVSAGNTLSMSNAIGLRGAWEVTPAFPHLGRRYVPKNVGYALVVAGLADVFTLVTARTGRMVSYEVRPVDGMPLDINTITFLINPAYTYNGSLDGLVGSAPADDRFYGHVPAMRAQFGSLYPASYFRPAEAYKLAAELEKKDKDREAYFMNYDATNVEQVPDTGVAADDTSREQAESEAEDEAATRKAAITSQFHSIGDQTRAVSGFADWQARMQGHQRQAGKRNIVNKYVWDADGGLRAETQSFADTIVHSVGCEVSHTGGLGAALSVMTPVLAMDLNLFGTGRWTRSASKRLSREKAFELSVDLSGLESEGITGLDDTPLQPGEKVDRYRLMSFYLEGDSKHFDEFFTTVVDPEWLLGNDEEARALREVRTGKANACWRVLHRVTHVERPALMGFGRDVRALKRR